MSHTALGKSGAPYLSCKHFFAAAVSLAIIAGCSSQDVTETTVTSDTPSNSAASEPAQGDPLHPKIRIATSAGDIVVKLDAERSPGTVQNFLDYVNQGFYADTLVHFVDPGKMILGGGYSLDGQLKETRLSILNEAHNGLKNKRGTIAMARNPKVTDGATTQFFINLTDAPELDHVADVPDSYGYCVFGTVTEGLDIADGISQVPTQNRGGDLFQTPRTPVVIESIQVVL